MYSKPYFLVRSLTGQYKEIIFIFLLLLDNIRQKMLAELTNILAIKFMFIKKCILKTSYAFCSKVKKGIDKDIAVSL